MKHMSKQKAKWVVEAINRKGGEMALFETDDPAGFRLRKPAKSLVGFIKPGITEGELLQMWNERLGD